MGGLGVPRIVENTWISKHFRGSDGGVGARAAPESLETYGSGLPWRSQNHCKYMVFYAFSWFRWWVGARAAPESLKIYKLRRGDDSLVTEIGGMTKIIIGNARWDG